MNELLRFAAQQNIGSDTAPSEAYSQTGQAGSPRDAHNDSRHCRAIVDDTPVASTGTQQCLLQAELAQDGNLRGCDQAKVLHCLCVCLEKAVALARSALSVRADR